MRMHTISKHDLQITRYKELYGLFEIIEQVFHKCHICGKLVLLDNDALGIHIKKTHKMKEKDYKERFMIYVSQSTSKMESQPNKIPDEATPRTRLVSSRQQPRFPAPSSYRYHPLASGSDHIDPQPRLCQVTRIPGQTTDWQNCDITQTWSGQSNPKTGRT